MQLARVNPDYWGLSLCTVDGQRFSIGDTNVPFTLQSCSKPLTYAIALEQLGAYLVHQYIGQEPSGRNYNELVLDYNSEYKMRLTLQRNTYVGLLFLYRRKATQSHDKCWFYFNLRSFKYVGAPRDESRRKIRLHSKLFQCKCFLTALSKIFKLVSFSTFSAWLVGLISALITPCFCQNERLLIVTMLSASICANTNVFQKTQTCESVWTSIFR